jgi:phage terminase large subunit
MNLEIPQAALECLTSPATFKVLYGGRGGGRSWSASRYAIAKTMARKELVLCTRQYQKSIDDSIHRLISNQIAALGLSKFFTVQNTTIINNITQSEFIFYGIHHQPDKIKSLEGVTITICEEAEKFTKESINILEPTVLRTANPEMIVLFNPNKKTDPVYNHYVLNPPPDTFIKKLNFSDNPWFPETLNKQRLHMQRTDPEAYAHIWLGEFLEKTKAQVLSGKWSIDAFTPEAHWDGPYFGADWGFSVDPTTLVKCWVFNNKLFIEHEIFEVGLELDHTPAKFKTIPGAANHIIRGDNARPETISYLNRMGGLNVEAAKKGAGSVEDGVAFLRAFDEIIIHDRCTNTANEARLWSYKTDRLSGDVLPVLDDKNNHIWDAVRYALEPIMKQQKTGDFILI